MLGSMQSLGKVFYNGGNIFGNKERGYIKKTLSEELEGWQIVG
jgi:hypothetical protein